MPEGPSLILLKEKLQPFIGKKITESSGYAEIDYDLLINRNILDIRTLGKHLYLCLPKVNIRVHLGLFGSCVVNGRKKKDINAKLHLGFSSGEINFYVVSVKLQKDVTGADWASDVMGDEWSATAAKKKMKAMPQKMICDVLMDQAVFAGVGNIIKNEVLWRTKVHPASLTGKLPATTVSAIVKDAVKYSFIFLAEKRAGTLTKNLQVYGRENCPRCGTAIEKNIWGTAKRKTYVCPKCQVRYD